MTRIIAAIDSSAVSRTVLARAVELSRLLDLDLDALHVREDGATGARSCAQAFGVSLDERPGDPVTTLLDAGAADDVELVAFGTRDFGPGPRPGGHVSQMLLGSLTKPCLLVPPEAACARPLRRVVVALEADAVKAQALAGVIQRAHDGGAELILVHVDDQASLPMFSNHAGYDAETYSHEFLARYASTLGREVRLELRIGDPAEEVLGVVKDVGADLLVLSWRGVLDPGRAPVVRELLAHLRIPMLLVPMPVPSGGSPRGREGDSEELVAPVGH